MELGSRVTKGTMATNPFLEQFGFIEDPFASTNAGQEPRLPDYFVPPPYFHSVLGDPKVPQSHVVLAPRGGGKTAQRRMVEDFSVQDESFLCVTYDKFELPAGFKLGNADLAYHLAQVSKVVLLALLVELDERPQVAASLSNHQKGILKFGATHFLGAMSAAEFESALGAIKSRGDKVRDWLKRYQLVMTLVNLVSNKLGLGAVSVADGSFQLGTQDQSLRYQLGQLLDIATTIGFSSTYILIDRVDELGLTSTDAKAAFSFIQSLITDLPTLESPGGAFKFFMWDQIEDSFNEAGSRPDRVPQFRLRWSVAQLEEMMSKRLSAFSSGRIDSLNALVCDDSRVDLHKLVAYLASGSPRDMVRLSQRIVAEETREAASARCLSDRAILGGVRLFSRDRAGRVRQGGVTPQRHPDPQLAATSSPLTSSVTSPSITSSLAFARDSELM
jgi:hypothetical protein